MSVRFADPRWRTHARASNEATRTLDLWCRHKLPADLSQLLQRTDGAELDHIEIWSAETIASDPMRAHDFDPNFLFFGCYGDGEMFAYNLFDARPSPLLVNGISKWARDSFPVARDIPHLIDRIELVANNSTASLRDRWT